MLQRYKNILTKYFAARHSLYTYYVDAYTIIYTYTFYIYNIPTHI